MTRTQGIVFVLAIYATIIAAVLVLSQETSRTFWPVSINDAAVGNFHKHTHVSVSGLVAYCVLEADGDRHIKLTNADSSRFIVAEIIPEIPLSCPAKRRWITVRGISRQDSEHLWYEVHPVESWSAQ